MIIYGWNNRVIKEAPIDNISCEHCGNEKFKVKILGHYVHIFWIPLFPYKKQGLLECDHCKSVVSDHQLANQLKDAMKRMKQSVKFPKYLFSGSALLIALFAFLFINSNIREDREYGYLKNPEVGDVYHFKDSDEPTEYKYYLWKAEELFEDSLYISTNGYAYNQVPTSLLVEDGFYDTYYVIDKNALLELYESGDLVKIQREYNESSGFNRVLHYEMDSLPLLSQ